MISSEIWKGHNRVGPPWSFSESSSAVGVAPRANEFTKRREAKQQRSGGGCHDRRCGWRSALWPLGRFLWRRV